MYNPKEQDDLLERFKHELEAPTKDGGTKRARGDKEPWYIESSLSHFLAALRHLARYVSDPNGRDSDNCGHHLTAVAWRCLAIVCKDNGNYPGGGQW